MNLGEEAPVKFKRPTASQVILAMALVATLGGAAVSSKMLADINGKIAEAKEALEPADIEIVTITAPDCPDCFDPSAVVDKLKEKNVTVGSEKELAFDSDEAKSLIASLNITRVPTIVVKGEVEKESLKAFLQDLGTFQDNAFIFTDVPPLYVNPSDGAIVGAVKATYLTDASCISCFNPETLGSLYERSGVVISEKASVAYSSAEGQKLMSQYNITRIPTVIFSSDLGAYEAIVANWSQAGSIETDGSYVTREVPVPYRDVTLGKIVGLVEVIYLDDASCADCYDPKQVHREILTNGYGVGFSRERVVDVNSVEGKGLVKTYGITDVPTFLLSADAGAYARLSQVWPSVGTVEESGWYVFRKLEAVGVVYKNLETNEIVGTKTSSDE